MRENKRFSSWVWFFFYFDSSISRCIQWEEGNVFLLLRAKLPENQQNQTEQRNNSIDVGCLVPFIRFYFIFLDHKKRTMITFDILLKCTLRSTTGTSLTKTNLWRCNSFSNLEHPHLDQQSQLDVVEFHDLPWANCCIIHSSNCFTLACILTYQAPLLFKVPDIQPLHNDMPVRLKLLQYFMQIQLTEYAIGTTVGQSSSSLSKYAE